MVNVCCFYCGTELLLESFETKEEAEEFMKTDYVLFYSDEIDGEEDEIIHPEEMFIDNDIQLKDEEIPFCEPTIEDLYEMDELPF